MKRIVKEGQRFCAPREVSEDEAVVELAEQSTNSVVNTKGKWC